MSFVSFWHHPIAVYNGDDSLMTPKWGPRQARSWQLSLFLAGDDNSDGYGRDVDDDGNEDVEDDDGGGDDDDGGDGTKKRVT